MSIEVVIFPRYRDGRPAITARYAHGALLVEIGDSRSDGTYLLVIHLAKPADDLADAINTAVDAMADPAPAEQPQEAAE